MPNKTILPPPYLTLEDANGATITNGSVKFLETGTSVLAVVYADADGLVVSANPLTVDGAGRYTVFVTPGQVLDLEFYDQNGALVHTVDQVQAIPSTANNVDVQGSFVAGATYGQVVYLSVGYGGFATAGQWYTTTATFSTSAVIQPTIGIALATIPAGGTGAVRLAGRVTDLAGLIVGAPYYVSDTAGALSLRPGTNARLVGQADTTTSLVLWANPPDIEMAVDEQLFVAGTVTQLVTVGRTLYIENTGVLRVEGIKAGYHGQRLRILAAQTGQVDFVNMSLVAAPADRLTNLVANGATSIVGYGGWVDYEYDAIRKYWRLMGHEQGGWITPAFNAADWTGNGGMTWTVPAGVVAKNAVYWLKGKTLFVQVMVSGGVIAGAGSNPLIQRTMPGGYREVGGSTGTAAAVDAAGDCPMAIWLVAGNTLQFYKHPSGAVGWALGGNLLYANMCFDVI